MTDEKFFLLIDIMFFLIFFVILFYYIFPLDIAKSQKKNEPKHINDLRDLIILTGDQAESDCDSRVPFKDTGELLLDSCINHWYRIDSTYFQEIQELRRSNRRNPISGITQIIIDKVLDKKDLTKRVDHYVKIEPNIRLVKDFIISNKHSTFDSLMNTYTLETPFGNWQFSKTNMSSGILSTVGTNFCLNQSTIVSFK